MARGPFLHLQSQQRSVSKFHSLSCFHLIPFHIFALILALLLPFYRHKDPYIHCTGSTWEFRTLSHLRSLNFITSLETETGTSLLFSRPVVCDSLRPHELQHARPSCPSLSVSRSLPMITNVASVSHLSLERGIFLPTAGPDGKQLRFSGHILLFHSRMTAPVDSKE